MRVGILAFVALGLGVFLEFQGVAWSSEASHGGGAPWGDFFQRVLNFVIMVGILVWLLKKPFSDFFSSRRETIRKTLVDLEHKKKEAEKHCAEYRAKLAALDKETEKIVAEYVEEGEVQKQKIIQAAEAQAEYIKQQAQLAISQEIRTAREKLQQEVAELSAAAAEDILKKNIRFEDQEKLVREFTTKVVEAK